MKQWFPFTDYDFYGYLACGLITLFVIDYWYADSQYLNQDHWTFVQGILAISVAYIMGQVIAMPSSIILEHGLARSVLRPPILVLMSDKKRLLENLLGTYLIGRYYQPLPAGLRNRILNFAERDTGLTSTELLDNPEEIFMPAYNFSCQNGNIARRMDDFRNQYGFSRNMAFTGLIATLLIANKADTSNDAYGWITLSLLLSFGMLVRFLKFYSSFTAEILRNYGSQ